MILNVVTVDYKIEDNTAVIYVFTRALDGSRYTLRDSSFEPYFYVEEEAYKSVQLCSDDASRIKRIEKVNVELLGTRGRGVLKIVTFQPVDVAVLRKKLESSKSRNYPRGINTYEADIIFPYRFLIDKGVTNGVEVDDQYFKVTKDMDYIPWSDKHCRAARCQFSSIKYFLIDIETRGDLGTNSFDVPVTVIGVYNSSVGQYLSFYWREEPSYSSSNILYHKTEKEMLLSFLSYLRREEPDLVVSFTPFDVYYIIKRLEALRIPCYTMSPIGTVRAYSEEHIKIGGLQYLDIREIYRTVVRGQKFEDLDSIARRELGFGKQPLSHGTILETWKLDYYNVITYNLRDVLLLRRLDEKYDLIEYLDTVRSIVGCRFNDGLYPARVSDLMYLRLVKIKGIALPSRNIIPVKRSYTGAVVFPVKKGVYSNVLCLDFKSMYPSVIRALNIGYNTITPIGDIPVAEHEGTVYRYTSRVKSWTVEILEKLSPLLDENSRFSEIARQHGNLAEVKKLKRRRMAIKGIINGCYGFYGYSGNPEEHTRAARLYHPAVAESITLASRMIIEKGAEIVKELGYELVYGDTDSLFVKAGNSQDVNRKPQEVAMEILSRLHSFVKERWNVDPSSFYLEVDTYYKKLLLLAKKRYCGLTIEGDKVYKGIEVVRREQSDLTVETQSGLIDLILQDAPVKSIREFVKRQVEKLYSYPLEKVALSGILSKSRHQYPSATQHLKAFLFSNDVLGLNLVEGERFNYVFIHPCKHKKVKVSLCLPKGRMVEVEQYDGHGNLVKEKRNYVTRGFYSDVVAFRSSSDLAKSQYPLIVDYDRLLETTIRKKVEDLLELVNITWSDVTNEKKNRRKSKLDYYLHN